MKVRQKISVSFARIGRSVPLRAVRSGLVNLIPVLIIGAFALVLKTFPVDAYQKFITTFLGGFLFDLFNLVNTATFGVLSVYMTYSISRSYMKIIADRDAVNGGAAFASLLCFFILCGVELPSFSTDALGPKSMFVAILAGLGASSLYLRIDRKIRSRNHFILPTGADRDFNRMLSTLFPVAITAVVFAAVNLTVISIFKEDSFRTALASAAESLFSFGETGFFKGLLFVFLSSLLWFFGIHGSDTLEGVMQKYFVPGLAENQAAVLAGREPTQILTKQFFDCFVLLGGCGATICLLIAILFFSRDRSSRRLGAVSSLPMIFNINELMVFGLPIIFNPIMLIPFLAVPVVCYSVSYFALSTGLVPLIANEIEWTTPIILGGYQATGSAAGAALQIFNVMLGVVIYIPFVRMMDRRSLASKKREFSMFMDFYTKNETEFTSSRITELENVYGDFARGLAMDIRHGMNKCSILAYQPQYNYTGEVVGVEALLRWQHPVHGPLYPPLVIKLAEDGGFLPDLEEAIVRRALADRPDVLKQFGKNVRISVNVTGSTITTQRFLNFCHAQNDQFDFKGKNICLEVTENAALSFNDKTLDALRSLRQLGLSLAIDDFSMGQTSIHYLKDGLFHEIKLDGSLVKGIFTHKNCREIISSIVNLSSSLNMEVVAEFVENEQQRDALHEIGCNVYQGHLYSPAVYLKSHQNKQE